MVTEPVEMSRVIAACRGKFGPAPRRFSLLARFSHRVRPPDWLRKSPEDKIWQIYRDRPLLLCQGTIVWAALVQANHRLFSPGAIDSPAAVVYSPDPCFDAEAETLRSIGRSLYALKGTAPTDPALWQFAFEITNERERSFGLAVPEPLTEGRQVFFGTIMVHRRDLPDRYLARGLFPLVICPAATPTTLILPARYWGEDLLALWRRKQAGDPG